MATAPHSAGWDAVHNRKPLNASRLTNVSTGIDSAGTSIMTAQFPPSSDPLRLVVEVAWGANLATQSSTWVWSDITGDVLASGNINITIGRADESSTPQPASMNCTLDNRTGDYSRGIQSRNYPNVRKNLPVRVRVNYAGKWVVRFFGYAVTLTPAWDITGKYAVVKLVAAGTKRRLSQHNSPTISALRRYIPKSPAAPTLYWPLEEGSGGAFATPLIGVTRASLYGVNSGSARLTFGSDDTLVSSSKTVGLENGAGFIASKLTATTSVQWAISYAYKANGTDGGPYVFLNPSISFYVWIYVNSDESITLYKNASPLINISVSSLEKWHFVELYLTNNGSGANYNLRVDGVNHTGTMTGVTMSKLTQVIVASASVTQGPAHLGHFAVYNAGVSSVDTGLYSAFTGNANEYSGTRMSRLFVENSEVLTRSGLTQQRMGPQTVKSFIDLVEECAAVDGGILYDGVNQGLQYNSRLTRQNQPSTMGLNANTGEIEDPTEPIDDDQMVLNSFTATRTNGGTVPYIRTDGPFGTTVAGTYDGSATLNFAADGQQVQDYAAWQVHLGTDLGFGYRWPSVRMAIHHKPEILSYWLRMLLLDRLAVLGIQQVRPQHPVNRVDLLLEGYTETIGQFTWDVTANTTPYDPWRMAVFAADTGDTSEYVGRYHPDEDSATVTVGCATAGTTITVTTAGPRWTTAADDFPLTLDIGGMLVTCTAITGTGATQTFTLDPTTVTSPIPIGIVVAIGNVAWLDVQET